MGKHSDRPWERDALDQAAAIVDEAFGSIVEGRHAAAVESLGAAMAADPSAVAWWLPDDGDEA